MRLAALRARFPRNAPRAVALRDAWPLSRCRSGRLSGRQYFAVAVRGRLQGDLALDHVHFGGAGAFYLRGELRAEIDHFAGGGEQFEACRLFGGAYGDIPVNEPGLPRGLKLHFGIAAQDEFRTAIEAQYGQPLPQR